MSVYSLIIVLLVLLACLPSVFSVTYESPEIICHPFQSPINLESDTAKPGTHNLTFNLQFNNPQTFVTLRNTGSEVLVDFGIYKGYISIDDVIYKESFLQLKWGNVANKGSEHSIDGKFFSGELELYFVNYDSDAIAFQTEDVVVSVLLQEDADVETDEPFFEKIKSQLGNIVNAGGVSVTFNSTETKEMPLESILPCNLDYFSYPGSMYLNCDIHVKRIVLKTPIHVSLEFMQQLRRLKGFQGSNIVEPRYKLKEENGRPVYKSFTCRDKK